VAQAEVVQRLARRLGQFDDEALLAEVGEGAVDHLGDLSNGGRGIRNQLEARLLNPLSRALFDQDAQPGERFLISALDADGLTLERR
ncbi:ATP-dependent Clp protease ATP-binding subunit, partial [Pseudomonas aeruginosa]|nr:ATP-dependent Clp protease ATP-binding subunit [Pseudomonas aeruginosa]